MAGRGPAAPPVVWLDHPNPGLSCESPFLSSFCQRAGEPAPLLNLRIPCEFPSSNPLLVTLGTAAICAALALGPAPASAQAQPANSVRIVVGYPGGQSTDIIARNYAVALQRELGQTAYVDNKPGANGILGAVEVKRAPPDGKTILFGTSGQLAINPSLYKKLPYDTTKDFVPVALLVQGPLVLVTSPSFPANSIAELIAMAKSKPEHLNYGSGGQGITAHLAMEVFADAAGIKLQHVPYKGSPTALTDVMGGTIPMMFEPTISAIPTFRQVA
jgi:tripartite-type tricarboxylate transporter receptor subunit TctC